MPSSEPTMSAMVRVAMVAMRGEPVMISSTRKAIGKQIHMPSTMPCTSCSCVTIQENATSAQGKK